jgi:hypothetical protein
MMKKTSNCNEKVADMILERENYRLPIHLHAHAGTGLEMEHS